MGIKITKGFKRSSFLFMSLGFIIVGSLGLYALIKTEMETKLNADALIDLTEIKNQISSELFYLQKYSGNIARKRKVNHQMFKADLKKRHLRLKESASHLWSNESAGFLGSLKVSTLFFSNEWLLDENLNHLLKINKTITGHFDNKSWDELGPVFSAHEAHSIKTLDRLRPIIKALKKNREYLNLVKNIILSVVSFMFVAILGAVYFSIYRPWKKSYLELEVEKGRLQEILRESEIRGNTFSWEVNYQTKETKRSNHLSGIFEIREESESFFLYDEVSLFSEGFQEHFMKAVDRCASKGDILDIEISLQTKNKKNYWLHYYARRREVGKEIFISGTVRDITYQKLAEQRFELLFESIKTPCLIFGEGEIRSLNQAAIRFFGLTEMGQLDKLHPAILFPLYQMDGNSSLEKLRNTVNDLKVGKVITGDWSFQTNHGQDMVGNSTFMSIPFPEIDLHLMVITDDSQKIEYERRLVDANRRALHARRLKLEYVTKMGIILQDLSDIVKEEVIVHEKTDIGHFEKVKLIQDEINGLWDDNLNQSMDEGANIVLTNLHELMKSLERRWKSIAVETNNSFQLTYNKDAESFFWLDSSKLRLALMALVEGALKVGCEENIELIVETNFIGGRHGKVNFSLKHSNHTWPGDEWKKLIVTQKDRLDSQVRKPLSLANFFNIIEILQGEIFFEKTELTSIVGFQCYVERAVGLSQEDMKKGSQVLNDEKGPNFTLSASDIWSHFGGDWDIIETTIKDFIDYYPVALADMIYYLRMKNSEELVNISTDLYGVLSHFPFFNSIERIIRIQKFSHYLKFDKLEDEIEALSYDLSSFSRALQEFLPDEKNNAA
ncbi:MAG: hypothetical protein K9K67_06225 [Bacteriovoracaceae bacterium]|nr:hypothetical protein [Bacteriovoracaceae bacterium]